MTRLMVAGRERVSRHLFAQPIHTLMMGLFCLALVALSAPRSYAQGQTARIDGFVRDASGAVIPGAAVTLKDVATGNQLHATTDASGFYDFEAIPPKNNYTLTVSMKGFATFSQPNLSVHADDRLEIPVTLTVATQVQEVQVSASAVPLVTTDSGAKTDVIGANEIENISTLGRSAVELLSLLPGVVGFNTTPGYIGMTGTSFGTGVDAFNINGLRSDMNDVRLDSAHMIDPGCNCGNIIEPNMDMIQEFSVKSSNFEADQGRSAMIMDTVMKSGGAQFHGEAYWYVRNAYFNANDWSNNFAGIPRPASKFNYPGFNLGGPVRLPHSDFNKNNDKMFFFVNMELQKQLADPGTELGNLPTAKMLNGDFTEMLPSNAGGTNPNCVAVDGNNNVVGTPGAGAAVRYDGPQHNLRAFNMPCDIQDPNSWGSHNLTNIIPVNSATGSNNPNGFTAAGQTMLGQWANAGIVPNYVDPSGQYNFAGRPIYPLNRNLENIRVDFNLKENLRAYVHLARNADHQFYPYGLWSGENSGWTSNVPQPSNTRGINSGKSVVLNVVQVINPTLTNEVQFNAQSLNLPNTFTNPSKLSKSSLGLNFPGMQFTLPADKYFATTQQYTGKFIPQITDCWCYGAGGGGSPGLGQWGEGDVGNGIFADKTEFEGLDNLTKVHGTHTMKFGFAADRTRNDQNGGPVPEGMLITQNWGGMGTNNEFGDILTEHFKAFQQGLPNRDGLWRFWNVEWYAQDSWKAARRLTLNYGARWSWLQQWYETRGFATTFLPSAYDPANPTNFLNGIVTAQSGKIPNSAFPNPKPILQPRVGFALDVFGSGKTVLRGGFGTFVSRDQGNIAFYQTTSPPFTFSSAPNAGSYNGAFDLATIATLSPFSAVGNIGLTAEDTKDPNMPQTYEWSFMLEQNLGLKTVLQTAYVGNTTRHLYRGFNANAIRPGTMFIPGTTQCCANGDTNQPDYNYYKPYGTIQMNSHSDTSNYNSLQVTARRNVASGLTILANYTWSRTLGYTTSFQGVIDPFDAHRDYGLLPWDRGQLFNFSYIYQMPAMGAKHNMNRFAKGVLDSWQISGVGHIQDGSPLFPTINGNGISCHDTTLDLPAGSITNGATGNNNECTNGWFDFGNSRFSGGNTGWYGTGDVSLRPFTNWVKGSSRKVTGLWANPSSVALPGINKFGTFEVPTFRGPGLWSYDMTLFKSFPLGESKRLEFRLASFDLLNHGNVANPGMGTSWQWNMPANLPSCKAAGCANPTTNAFSLGSPQLLNVPGTGKAPQPGNFGYVSDAFGHREVEMALKFYF